MWEGCPDEAVRLVPAKTQVVGQRRVEPQVPHGIKEFNPRALFTSESVAAVSICARIAQQPAVRSESVQPYTPTLGIGGYKYARCNFGRHLWVALGRRL